MIQVRFVESRSPFNLIDNVDMDCIPRVGELVSFLSEGDILAYRVDDVEHVLKTAIIDLDFVTLPIEIKCKLSPIGDEKR